MVGAQIKSLKSYAQTQKKKKQKNNNNSWQK
jgi:hypothetical protein